MAPFKRGGVWWYKFYFAGQLIRESSKSTSKTVAKEAEKERRKELEAGYNSIKVRGRQFAESEPESLANLIPDTLQLCTGKSLCHGAVRIGNEHSVEFGMKPRTESEQGNQSIIDCGKVSPQVHEPVLPWGDFMEQLLLSETREKLSGSVYVQLPGAKRHIYKSIFWVQWVTTPFEMDNTEK
jgi:hypothetical protein